MPYIDAGRRKHFDDLFNGRSIESPGELNYIFFKFAQEYLAQHGAKYQTFNDISGAFTESLAEFRRRYIAPYEDKKIESNGDVL